MSLEPDALADQIARIAVLDEPLRRRLYFFVAAQPGEVTRDEAADALGVSRALAAFHLDKLAENGLLEIAFRRLSGRSGPGAGRPSKLYRPARRQLAVSLPERRYELAAQLLLQAMQHMPAAGAAGGGARDAVRQAAHAWGRRLGVAARARASDAVTSERLLQEALEVLRQCGFEPRRDEGGDLVLRNCPFETLASEHRDLVCGMNEALLQGLVAGLELVGVTAQLDPQPGMCCVVLRSAAR